MNHLYLPKIINFKVSSFFSSLFKTDEELNLSLHNSLNILIGKNSIGKTTTIELILFSIIGNYKFDVDFSNSKNSFLIDISNKKFLTRIKKLQNEIKTQLIFKIADKQIELHRNINTGKITKFLLDKKEILTDDLDKEYIKIITSLTNLSFENFIFILKEFLILEEEDSYIVWNENKQNKIFLTFFDCNIKKFEELTQETKALASQQKQERHHRTDLYNQRNKLQEELDELKKHIDSNYNPQKIELLNKNINKLSQTLNNQHKLHDSLEINIIKIKDELNKNLSYREEISDELSVLEFRFYGNIYNKYLHYYNKLHNYNICSFCNTKVNETVITKLNNFKIKNKCAVCDSLIKLNENSIPKNILENMENKRSDILKIEKDMVLLNKELKEKEKEISKIRKDIEENLKQFNQDKEELFKEKIIQSEYEKFINKSENNFNEEMLKIQSGFSLIEKQISTKNKKIEEYEKQIQEKNILLNNFLQDIKNNYQKELDIFISKLNENIKLYFYTENENIIFEKIEGEEILLSEFKINVNENKEGMLYHVLPKLNDNLKTDPKSLSTSERLIIEYIFRLTLLEYLEKTNDLETFLILETSEGSFDYLKVSDLASTINDLSNRLKSSVIVVTNVHDPYFLAPYATENNTFSFFDLMSESEDKNKLKELVDKIILKKI